MARLGHLFASNSEHVVSNATPGTPPSNATLAKALSWFERALEAEATPVSALLGLGVMNLHGMGVQQNSTRAFQLLKRAAAIAGDEPELAEARYHLGIMWYWGWGVTKASPFEAQRLWLEAASVRCGLPPCTYLKVNT
jgi:TPR repeat protein